MGLIDDYNLLIYKVRGTAENYIPSGRWFTYLVDRLNEIFEVFVETIFSIKDDTEFIKDSVTVSEKNSTDNKTIADVIGNRTDTSFSNGITTPSLIGHAKAGYHHVHSPAKVYPSLANSVQITAPVAAWTLGNKIEVIPTNAITTWFDIHWIIVHSISANDEYELVLYKGLAGAEIEIGRIVFVKTAAQAQEGNLPIQVPPQLPNTRISAALASKTGNDNVTIKLYYHQYSDIV